jgi:hypothetical protein
MRARPIAAALAIALGGVVPPYTALAAPPAPPGASASDLATAKKLFETGLKLYREGSYREALASFRRANDLSPRASIQRNIAQCNRDLKDFGAAYEAYQVLLSRYGTTMNAPDKRAVQRAIEELAMLTGTLRVTVAEPGATVTVDDHEVSTTPLAAPVRVGLGPHVVVVAKAGFEPIRREIKVSGGDEARIDGPLQPEVTTGHLVVDAPAGAKVEVFVDGEDVGAAPWEGDVKPGVHVVEAKGADRNSAPKPLDVALRARVEMVLELTPNGGRVQVDTHTADASITIDGQPMGRGVWEGMLPAGEHQVIIEAGGYRTYKRAFLVHAGETFVEDARLVGESAGGPPHVEGIYSGLAFFGDVSATGASNTIAKSCPQTPCDISTPLGAGLLMRIGYSFGWLGVEGIALGEYDHSSASLTYNGSLPPSSPYTGVARTESYDFHRFGGGGALGVRVATKNPHVRFTAGAFGGVIERGNVYKRQDVATGSGSSSDSYTSDTLTYTAPLFLFDAGALVGWENGPKFRLAALLMIEPTGNGVQASSVSGRTLGPTSQPLGTPALTLQSGTQVVIGPMLGFDFGL